MKKFEYLMIWFEGAAEDELNKYRADGWELISLDKHMLFLKRELQGD